jgi:hypothetical protein
VNGLPHERRRAPRVLPVEAYAAVFRPVNGAGGEPRFARLVDASAGGLAALAEDAFALGERLVVELGDLEGSTILEGAPVRVVAVGGSPDDQLVHCAFEQPPPDEWLESLALPGGQERRSERGRILLHVLDHGPVTSAAVAAALELPLALVESALNDLEHRGIVEAPAGAPPAWRAR